MALTVKIRGDATHLEKTLKGINKSVGGLGAGLGRAAIAGAGFAAALAGISTAEAVVGKFAETIKDSSLKAAGIESLTMQFETLLGSASKAKERMAEIKRFAASTPFEVANLSETSKLLQTLGGDMLATGDGLRMVGDAASIAGRPIQEVGLHIGRLYNAITTGTSAGEAVARLQELGLISGTVKRRFEDLAEAQKKGKAPIMDSAQALAELRSVLQKTEGAMLRLSATTEGKLSNLKDNVDNLKVSFGAAFNVGLKDALDAANGTLPQLESKFSEFGQVIGRVITDGINGNYDVILQAGILIGKTLKEGALMSFSELSSEAMRDFLMLGSGDYTPEQKAKSQEAVNQIVGAPRSAEQFVGDLKYVTREESRALDKAIAERQIEELRKTRLAVERLFEKGIKVTKESLAVELHSR